MDSFEIDNYTFSLSIVIVIGLFFIGGLVYHIIDISNKLNDEIMKIEDKFPECPDCNVKCPKCELTCPDFPTDTDCPECPECLEDGTKKCPECHQVNCPTVDEIVTGVFPGRNPKVMGESRYADINPANSYGGLSSTNFYEQKYKFPMDSILNPGSPIRGYNKDFNSELLNNSYNNDNINGSKSVSLTNESS